MGKSPKSRPFKPWTQGAKELLTHSFELLSQQKASLNRIAFICIDNSVELMIKTYLLLPKRLTKISVGRSKLIEQTQTFPRMLDLLAEVAPQKLSGLDINEIDWFHRVRNDLYHNGHGFLIEQKYAVIYGEIARQLFQNLYEISLELTVRPEVRPLSLFMRDWFALNQTLETLQPTPPASDLQALSPQLTLPIQTQITQLGEFHEQLVYGYELPKITDETRQQLHNLLISINKQQQKPI